MPETVLSSDGTAIAYETTGRGPVVVLVGGAFSTRDSLRPLADLLADRATATVYDRRGRGDSGPTTWVPASRQVDDLLAVFSVTGPAVVFGHSSGGILALLAAATSPLVRGVVAYEPPVPTGGAPDPAAAVFERRIRSLLRAGRAEEATEAWFARTSVDAAGEDLRHAPWWPALVALAPTLPDELTLVAEGARPSRFAGIGVPATILYGGASPRSAALSARALADAIPGGRLDRVPGEGHMVRFEALLPVLRPLLAP